MNVEKVINDGKEIIIIDDMLTYGAIDYFYILCCQSKYTICNASQKEIQHLEDRRLKCDLELNHPVLETFFQKDSETEKMLNKYISKDKYSYSRSYINLGVTSDVNNIHVDNITDSKTLLYYANRRWDPSWGGHTTFLDDRRKNIISTVTPMPGRIVIFDGRIPHNVIPMNPRSSPSYRFTIALKFELKKSESSQDISKEYEVEDIMLM